MASDLRFSLRDIQYTLLDNGYTIVATTDVPCHLWMRWTLVEPQIHTVPILRRGLYLHADKYFCFVSYFENEQEEAGDTLIHTFIKRNWPICQTRYFYFWATIGGIPCISTTAIFQLHFAAPLIYDALPCWHNRRLHSSHGTWSTARGGFRVHKIGQYQRPDNILNVGTWLVATYHILRAYQNFHTVDLPMYKNIIAAELGLYVTEKTGITGSLVITKGLWDEPVTPEDWTLQTDETTILGSIDQDAIIPGEYNWISFNQAGLDWINQSDLMLKQWESYDWRKTLWASIYDPHRHSQCFTPLYSHKMGSLKLRLKRIGDAGLFAINLKHASPAGCPTGDTIEQVTSYAILLSDAPWGDWFELRFLGMPWLEAGTTYALELLAPSGNASNRIEWIGASATPYPSGHLCYSGDSGHTWTPTPAFAAYFIEYEVRIMENGYIPPRAKVGGTNLCLRTMWDVGDVPVPPGAPQEIKYYSAQKGEPYKPLLRLHLEQY